MKKTEKLGEGMAPDGTALTLYRHDGDYYIRANGIELMSTRRHVSEERLATTVCKRLRDVAQTRVLIGGLGFGFTLAAALRSLSEDARVTVVEIVPEVIAWNMNREYALAVDSLADSRVELVRDDVGRVIAGSSRAFDAILLDVDNGAESFTTASNAGLYSAIGIQQAIAALKPGGSIGYWSDRDDPDFHRALERAGLCVVSNRVETYPGSGIQHTLLIGTLRA